MSSVSSVRPFQLIAAPFTPMNADGSVQYSQIGATAEFLRAGGVDGVFIAGTTGEGMSMTMAERKKLAEAWREAAGALKVIVHVGHLCLSDARELARHAESLGVAGVAAIGPCFFSVSSAEILAEYCQEIAAGAPQTPFYYYHIPSMARVQLRASEAFPELVKRVPTFAGIKFTHEDLEDYRRCLELADGRQEIFFGRDELLIEGLAIGATSAVGSTYNFAAPMYRQLIQAVAAGDREAAAKWSELTVEGIRRMIQHGGMAAFQAAMELAGQPVGELRLPLRALSPAGREQLRKSLDEIGYFDALAQLK